MDLNELPAEAYDIFKDVVETRNPMFCTQVPSTYDAVLDLPTIFITAMLLGRHTHRGSCC